MPNIKTVAATITLAVIAITVILEWTFGWIIYDQMKLWQNIANTAYTNALISIHLTSAIGIVLTMWLHYNKQTPKISMEKREAPQPSQMSSGETEMKEVSPSPPQTQNYRKRYGGGKKTKAKPKFLIAAFALMLTATMIMAYITVQAQTQTQYNTKPWFVTVYELESTLKGHLIQTTVNFATWRYEQAKILVKNEGTVEQACSITVLLQNKNNATIAYGNLADTGLIQPDLTAEYDIDLTWTGNATISDSREWFIGTTPHATQPPT